MDIFKNYFRWTNAGNASLKKIHIFSDGLASQFKTNMCSPVKYCFKLRMELKFRGQIFATSHGKGAVDALDGTVERGV